MTNNSTDFLGAVLACFIAVEQEHNTVGKPLEHLDVFWPHGGAQHRHGVVKPALMADDHVGESLDDNRGAVFVHVLASHAQRVQYRSWRTVGSRAS